ncbi:MAG: YdcF family protein [Thalassobaculaceae bacterium]
MKRYRSRLARRRATGRRRRLLAVGALLLALAWGAGFLHYVMIVADAEPPAVATRTDGVVALTGGALRMTTGLAVLSAGQADRLLVSGVHENFQKRFLRDMARDAGLAGDLDRLIECCVTLGPRARDTVGNARETAAWVAANGVTSLRLVTASYHIARALIAFREAMPALTIVAHPVTPPDVAPDRWFRNPRTAWLFAAEYTKLLVSQARQILRRYLTAPAATAG